MRITLDGSYILNKVTHYWLCDGVTFLGGGVILHFFELLTNLRSLLLMQTVAVEHNLNSRKINILVSSELCKENSETGRDTAKRAGSVGKHFKMCFMPMVCLSAPHQSKFRF